MQAGGKVPLKVPIAWGVDISRREARGTASVRLVPGRGARASRMNRLPKCRDKCRERYRRGPTAFCEQDVRNMDVSTSVRHEEKTGHYSRHSRTFASEAAAKEFAAARLAEGDEVSAGTLIPFCRKELSGRPTSRNGFQKQPILPRAKPADLKWARLVPFAGTSIIWIRGGISVSAADADVILSLRVHEERSIRPAIPRCVARCCRGAIGDLLLTFRAASSWPRHGEFAMQGFKELLTA